MQNLGATGPPANYQTVTLARGRHTTPQHGACVMELASMLAGEEFTDHPQSVCPVIGAFLRAYNDSVDDRCRQDLYQYAAMVVGTRSTFEVECRRADICREWSRRLTAHGDGAPNRRGSLLPPGRLGRRLHGARFELAGRRAGLAFGQAETDQGGVLQPDSEQHHAALRLVDELIAADACHKAQPAERRQTAPQEPVAPSRQSHS